ncbi:hypothetical protein KI387_000267, partial [Taxus chinensis]
MVDLAMTIGFSRCSKTSSLLSPGCSSSVICQGLEDFGLSQFGGKISRKRASYACNRRTPGGSKQTGVISCSCRNPFSGSSDYHLFSTTKRNLQTKVQVAADYSDSKSDPVKYQGELGYHPLEALNDCEDIEKGELKLKDAEIARTIVEVNNKATLMFTSTADVDLQDSIFWPDLQYVTDEYGDIYLEVHDDEDVLQSLSISNSPMLVFIGLDDIRRFNGHETPMHGISNDFDFEEISDSDTEIEEDYEEDWISFLEEESLGDWAKLETMHSVHPIYFSRKLAEVVSTDYSEKMDRPLQGLAILGLIRPAFMEEQSHVRKFLCDENSDDEQLEESIVDKISESEPQAMTSLTDGTVWAHGLENDEGYEMESLLYKLEIVDIQLLSHYGNQSLVNLHDFQQAEPDILAHSASTIMARINAGGKKAKTALKSLCKRTRGIQVEEATLIGVDSLGIDVRICSGIELQTLRFAFNCR